MVTYSLFQDEHWQIRIYEKLVQTPGLGYLAPSNHKLMCHIFSLIYSFIICLLIRQLGPTFLAIGPFLNNPVIVVPIEVISAYISVKDFVPPEAAGSSGKKFFFFPDVIYNLLCQIYGLVEYANKVSAVIP